MTRTRALFCDFLGLPKGKYIPSDLAKSGDIGFAACALSVSFDRDLLNIPGTGLFDGIPDMKLSLSKDRYKSWQENTEIALGDLKFDGQDYELCSRSNLKRIIKEYNKIDLNPMVGLEFEAYVFEQDQDGIWMPYNTPGAFVYGTGPSNDPKNLMGKIWEQANEMDLPVESINGEYDNGQFELTLGFDEALKACDNAFLFKTMAKEIAMQEGLMLSFMPKPIPERGGSGLHVNFSFLDKSKINVIENNGKLSETANNCISGLLQHHEGLSALLASTVNSYDRLQPASMAGYWANWAGDHRMVSIRTSTSSSNSARIEHRTADGAGNPYIVTSSVLTASLLGIKNKYKLPKAEDLDGMENVRATKHVPSSLSKALSALENDNVLKSEIGEKFCNAFIEIKRDEATRLQDKNIDEIREYYLPFV